MVRKLLQIYMNTSLVKKQRGIFLVVWGGSQEVELVVAVAAGYGVDVLGQKYVQSILVRMAVDHGEGRAGASFDTCMVEVERYCVIPEN